MSHHRQCHVNLGLAILAAGTLALNASLPGSRRGQHKQIYAVLTPGDVTIDARLADGDPSGQILSYLVPKTADKQSARTAMMNDAQFLAVKQRPTGADHSAGPLAPIWLQLCRLMY